MVKMIEAAAQNGKFKGLVPKSTTLYEVIDSFVKRYSKGVSGVDAERVALDEAVAALLSAIDETSALLCKQ